MQLQSPLVFLHLLSGIALLGGGLTGRAEAQNSYVVINEILASNTTTAPDVVDFDYYTDWIELKNLRGVRQSLDLYYLSDDPEEPTKWHLKGQSIEGNSFLLVHADGYGLGPGEDAVSQYWPFREIDVQKVHTNFRLGTEGETLVLSRQHNGELETVDSITFPPQVTDISYGRDPLDRESWQYLSVPTPSADNAQSIPAPVQAGQVTASLSPGIYARPQEVALETQSGSATIRFTLDGAEPNQFSPAYSEPIRISESTVLKARAFDRLVAPGPVLRQSFLIGIPDHSLPVVALSVTPDTFFGDEGIHSPTTRKGQEVPITMDYFPDSETHAFTIDAGVRIGGENIWQKAQKPLNLALRGKYGSDEIRYKLFEDVPLGFFDRVGLRNGGDNWSLDMLPDAMAAPIVRGQMDNAVSAARPVVVYLNGAYQGIHFMRERWGDSYFSNHYQVVPGTYDHVEHGRTPEGIRHHSAEGDHQDLVELLNTAETALMQKDAVYETFAAQIDIDAFIDYVAMVDFTAETSWFHNQEVWRHRDGDGKWRWLINDLDRSFNQRNVSRNLVDQMRGRLPLFNSLLKNVGFRDRFVQRYAAHIGSTFHPDRLNGIVESLREEMAGEIARHSQKWGPLNGIRSRTTWLAQVERRKNFIGDRGQHALSNARMVTSPQQTLATLVVQNEEPDGGRIFLCGVPLLPRAINSLEMLEDIPFDLKAVPAPGYRFAGWSTNEEDASITVTIRNRRTVIGASFEPIGAATIQSPITESLTIGPSDHPYVVLEDLIVAPEGHLTVLPGTVIEMAQGVSIEVGGTLSVRGTDEDPVIIRPHESASTWGSLGFVNAQRLNVLSNVKLIGATKSHRDPINLKAALSALNSDLLVIGAEISAPFPVFVQGGGISMFSSTIRPEFTGDGINVKNGRALIEGCTFYGNDAPDTDAIDTDDVIDGIIRENRIYHFNGSNSDAIDVGEGCVNLIVTGNRVYHCTDKGVSVGQGSSARILHNLFVGCGQGVGIKDEGSIAYITNNTFVDNGFGVAVFEKNFGSGGGTAQIESSLFVNSPLSVDELSDASVRHSMSDQGPFPAGEGNVLADPHFEDPSLYNFTLLEGSPGWEQGVGNLLPHQDDYPGPVPGSIIVNEVLTHSSAQNGDWIELHNRSGADADLSGWYLSDDKREPYKYRISEGTVLEAGGYLVFSEDNDFGSDKEPNIGFALSENGESVVITGPGQGLEPDYREVETFGPSAEDVSRGSYSKLSTGTRNFIAMAEATPGGPNSAPLVGPIVISEIMFAPESEDAEFIELLNISSETVRLYRSHVNSPWRVSDGIEYFFPIGNRVFMEPGERIVLTRDVGALRAAYPLGNDPQVYRWTKGRLNNAGEKVELSFPGDLDEGVRQYVRVDRVNYSVEAPWPVPDASGRMSLTRINVTAYGNDPANWRYEPATPGTTNFDLWWAGAGQGAEGSSDEDLDGDGRSNYFEYATGTNPRVADGPLPLSMTPTVEGMLLLEFPIADVRAEILYRFEASPDLTPGSWVRLETRLEEVEDETILSAEVPASFLRGQSQMYFRVAID